jgi:methionine synthase II (cobalamin-independent)
VRGDRIVVTHVGSLVRPPDLIPFLRAIDRGEPYDEAAHERCLTESVRDVVARQREAGVDVVSDGEYGKSAWNYYVYERLGEIELRPHAPGGANFASVNDAPTDWTRFPEFYADYFATQQEYDSAASRTSSTSTTARRRPRSRASRRRCARSTARSSTPACPCRSTTPTSPSCTT